MKNPIIRIIAWINSRIAKAVRRELNVIFRKEGEACIDYHMHSSSWAIIKVDVDDVCYLKFIDLGKQDLQEIQRFMKRFERSRIDAAPEVMHIMNGFKRSGIDYRWFE